MVEKQRWPPRERSIQRAKTQIPVVRDLAIDTHSPTHYQHQGVYTLPTTYNFPHHMGTYWDWDQPNHNR